MTEKISELRHYIEIGVLPALTPFGTLKRLNPQKKIDK